MILEGLCNIVGARLEIRQLDSESAVSQGSRVAEQAVVEVPFTVKAGGSEGEVRNTGIDTVAICSEQKGNGNKHHYDNQCFLHCAISL